MKDEFISFLKSHNLYDRIALDNYFNDAFVVKDIHYSGCLYIVDSNDTLLKIRACVPKIVDYETMLVNIHEYVHYYLFFKKIGKKVIIGRNCEVLPMLYEKIFIIEKNSDDLYEYEKLLNNSIDKNDLNYVYALKIRDYLLNMFDRCGKIKRLEKNNSH
ncbi:MAG: hypothetical protein IKF19_00020 [Bacilli bacterium]|nr:hypothetical protein [Bacilli bacterium]